eukprot:UN33175
MEIDPDVDLTTKIKEHKDLRHACQAVPGIICAVHKQGKGSNYGWKESWFYHINQVLQNDRVPPMAIRKYKDKWGSMIYFQKGICKLTDYENDNCHFTSNNGKYSLEQFEKALTCEEDECFY